MNFQYQAPSLVCLKVHIVLHLDRKRGMQNMYGAFGGYTRWAVVFLIIFVLFILIVPGTGYGVGATAAGTGVGAGAAY